MDLVKSGGVPKFSWGDSLEGQRRKYIERQKRSLTFIDYLAER
jgi:hypothetical protein